MRNFSEAVSARIGGGKHGVWCGEATGTLLETHPWMEVSRMERICIGGDVDGVTKLAGGVSSGSVGDGETGGGGGGGKRRETGGGKKGDVTGGNGGDEKPGSGGSGSEAGDSGSGGGAGGSGSGGGAEDGTGGGGDKEGKGGPEGDKEGEIVRDYRS